MQCPNCQATNESYALKCKFCGAPLRKPYASMESPVKGEVRLKESYTDKEFYADKETSIKAEMTEKKRSVGVPVIGIVLMLLGVFSLVEFVKIFSFLRWMNLSNLLRILSQHSSAFFTVTGIGILFKQNWARKLTLILSIYFVLFTVYENVINFSHWFPKAFSMPDFWIHGVLFTFVCIASIIYLTRPKVKRAFGERNPEPLSMTK